MGYGGPLVADGVEGRAEDVHAGENVTECLWMARRVSCRGELRWWGSESLLSVDEKMRLPGGSLCLVPAHVILLLDKYPSDVVITQPENENANDPVLV